MPRKTNPGDITTGPGKTVSSDTDELVLRSYAGGAGEGAHIPPGGGMPRAGYPALPCRACGGAGGSGGSIGGGGSVEDTVLTVGDPTLHPGWTGVTPDYATLGEAVAAAGALMDPQADAAGRNVRIWVIGPTLEPTGSVPITIPTDGLIIEGAAWTNDGGPPPAVEITWRGGNVPLFDIDGHSDLIFRNLSFNSDRDGVSTPIPPFSRVVFRNSSVTTSSNVVVDNCRSKGPSAHGFILSDTDIINWTVVNNQANTGSFGISTTNGGSLLHPPIYGRMGNCNITRNRFTIEGSAYQHFDGVMAYDVNLVQQSDLNVIGENTFTGYRHSVNVLGNGNTIDNNFCQESEEEAIITRGVINRVLKNGLLNCYSDPSPKTGISITGNSNVCRENIVGLDGDIPGDIPILVTGGDRNTVCDNDALQSNGEINLLTDESIAEGNHCAGFILSGNACIAQGNWVDGDFTLTGAPNRCTIGDNEIGGDFTIPADSGLHTITGNYIVGDILSQGSRCTVTGNIVGGGFDTGLGQEWEITGNKFMDGVIVQGDDCVIGDNEIQVGLAVTGDKATVSGNRVVGELVFVDFTGGSNHTITGNQVEGRLHDAAGVDDCVVADNVCEELEWAGDGSVISGNKISTNMTINSDRASVTGNTIDAALSYLGDESTITGNNVGSDISITGSDVMVAGNYGDNNIVVGNGSGVIVVDGNHSDNIVMNGGPYSTITGNWVGALNVAVNVPDCTITGNNVVNNISTFGARTTVTGNRVGGDIQSSGQDTTITGNWVQNAISTGPGSSLTIGDNEAEEILVGSADSTIGDNVVGESIFIAAGASGCTVTGNRVLLTVTVNANECTVDNNKVTGNITVTSLKVTVGDNDASDIVVGGVNITVSGNRVEGIIHGTNSSSQCTFGDNICADLLVEGPRCTITGNRVLNELTSDGVHNTVSGNSALKISILEDENSASGNNTEGDFFVGSGAVRSTVSGNVVANDMTIYGDFSTVNGNRVQNDMLLGVAGSGMGVVVVGNGVFNQITLSNSQTTAIIMGNRMNSIDSLAGGDPGGNTIVGNRISDNATGYFGAPVPNGSVGPANIVDNNT